MGRRVLAGSRFFIVIAVLGSFVSAMTLLLYGVAAVTSTIWKTATSDDLNVD